MDTVIPADTPEMLLDLAIARALALGDLNAPISFIEDSDDTANEYDVGDEKDESNENDERKATVVPNGKGGDKVTSVHTPHAEMRIPKRARVSSHNFAPCSGQQAQ